jgi:hypothetical protein
MSTGTYVITTRGTGTVLTAAIYNADHQNHVTNQNPQGTGAYSDNVAQMQLQVDPGGVGSESLPTSLAGELERLRFALARAIGRTNWYDVPTPGRGCLVFNAANQNITSGAFNNPTWDSEVYDTDAIHSTSVNTSRLTVPSPYTKVELLGRMEMAAAAGGTVRAVDITKNGSGAYAGYARVDSTSFSGTINTRIQVQTPMLDVVAGDFFEMRPFQDTGAGVNLIGGNTGAWFQMKLIK